MSRRLPAEWENQFAILLTWPHAKCDWGQDYTLVEQTFIAITRAVSKTQKVIIGTYDNSHQEDIRQKLDNHKANLNSIFFYHAPSNDVWARDHGPIIVTENGQTIQCDFQFNAWGQKYASELDNQIPSRLHAADILKAYRYQKIDFILEGGGIESDGQGTLLTTSHCLLNPHRNSQFTLSEIEQKLQEYLGIKRVLWLNNGKILGDDTDCHIDTLARFLNPHTIAYVNCEDRTDPHYLPLQKMKAELALFTNQAGNPYHLVPFPLPSPIYDQKGNRLPATYANFLITNHQVLVPTYDDDNDTKVLATFKQYFPDKEIIGIDCRAVIEQFGSLHCLTMQIPSVRGNEI